VSLVVSDSGPVHYLVLCEVIHVIPSLYGQLVIPSSVAEELTHAHAPAPVSAWIKSMPAWASIQGAREIDPAEQLGMGEREAIALARELKAAELLVDDRLARKVAVQRGLLITGTVGILEKAAERGLLNLSEALQKLLRTNFRVDAQVIREALEQDATRPRRSRERGLEH
jgi:predicted nucleic acid-binding protein